MRVTKFDGRTTAAVVNRAPREQALWRARRRAGTCVRRYLRAEGAGDERWGWGVKGHGRCRYGAGSSSWKFQGCAEWGDAPCQQADAEARFCFRVLLVEQGLSKYRKAEKKEKRKKI